MALRAKVRLIERLIARLVESNSIPFRFRFLTGRTASQTPKAGCHAVESRRFRVKAGAPDWGIDLGIGF